jgi:hypothetical protein
MDPHRSEYLAAVAGMAEHTLPSALHRTYAVGDFVSGVSCGKPWSGRIDWFFDNGDACIDVGGAWLSVPVRDITF